MCTWIWDIERDRVEWFGDLSPLLGLAPRRFGGRFSEYLEYVHPSDHERARALYVECLKGVRRTYRSEERIVRPDGSVRWLETYGRGRYSAGRATELAGVVRDVTEVRQQQEKFAAVFAGSPDAIAISRQSDSVMLDVNAAWLRCTGYRREAAVGHSALDLGLWKHQAERGAVVATIAAIGVVRNHATRFVRADGRVIDVMLSGVKLALDGVNCIVWTWSDVSELLEAKERLDRALRASGVCLWDADLRSGEIYLSEGWADLLGLPVAPTRTTLAELAEQVQASDVESAMRAAVEAMKGLRADYAAEHRVRAANGEWKWILSRGKVIERDPATGRALRMTGTNIDITARKQADARIEFLATHDALTALPNRSLLLDRLAHAVASAQRSRHTLAVLLLDLDRFKSVTDSLGHQIGDSLLKAVAARLARVLRKGDTVARLGGDEFVLVLEELKEPAAAAAAAQKVQAALCEAFVVDGHHLALAASIGISVFPSDGGDAETLLMNAEAAMQHAKAMGRNNFQFFSSDLNARALARARLEVDLRRALFSCELDLDYQPIFAPRDARPVAVEALARWRHPERGSIPPAEFIAVAEEAGIIGQVGEWVLDHALRQLAEWRAAGHRDLRMAVNVSPRQLSQGAHFVARVAAALDEHGIPGDLLDLEITENSLAENIEHMSALLRALADRGVRIAIDDFGTGYSSLGYLAKLPVQALKIDRSFVGALHRDPNAMTLVSTIVSLAHSLRLKVVAEGVESAQQADFLQRLGCDEMQGYHYSRPLPAAGIARLLRLPRPELGPEQPDHGL
jgi:diguanylate cyclase (GGDEF)-like protein/PAS domain S-box-containing protein